MTMDFYVHESFGPTKKLYKYYSNIDFAIKAIKTKQIHLDDPSSFNDPFEAEFLNSKKVSKYKISCFCEEWNSILMWSYYANHHKGVCIEYDVEQLRTSKNKVYGYLRPVHYSLVRPPKNDTVPEDRARCLLTKSAVWAHEHEWRLIRKTSEEFLDFDCITAVYFGARTDFTQSNVKKLIDAAQKESIPIHKCNLHTEEYRLIEGTVVVV